MTPRRRQLLAGLALALVVATFAAFAASPLPDGLERVAMDHGFLDRAQGPRFTVLPDYTIPGLGNGPLSTAVAGGVGVLLVTGITFGAGALIRRRRQQ